MKYPYYSQYQIWRAKCHAHDGIIPKDKIMDFEAEIFEKFITDNIKVAVEKAQRVKFCGKIFSFIS